MEEKKKRKARSGLRGVSRFCALQVLYRSEFSDRPISKLLREPNAHNSEAILSESISLTESEMDKVFFENLLKETEKNLTEIDQIISEHLTKGWSLDRLDPVSKYILRLGITELIYFKEIPSNVIFNEYVEIAKAFFDSSEVSFINGLLNKVEKNVREAA